MTYNEFRRYIYYHGVLTKTTTLLYQELKDNPPNLNLLLEDGESGKVTFIPDHNHVFVIIKIFIKPEGLKQKVQKRLIDLTLEQFIETVKWNISLSTLLLRLL